MRYKNKCVLRSFSKTFKSLSKLKCLKLTGLAERRGMFGLGVGEKSLVLTVQVLSEAMWSLLLWPQNHTVSGTDLSTSHSNSWKLKKQKLSQAFTTTA